jgi:hypothetical protein
MANYMDSEEFTEIINHFTDKNKPWTRKSFPRRIKWDSSVPASWKKLKKNQDFLHATDDPETRLTAYNLNNCKQFLFLLNNHKPKAPISDKIDTRSKNFIKLNEISKNLDLVNQNQYIAQKIHKKARSYNLSNLKKKYNYIPFI